MNLLEIYSVTIKIKVFEIVLLLISPLFSFSQSDDEYIYGEWCGIYGEQPEERVEIEKFIKDKNINNIEEWLNSPIPVKQTYAVEALVRLMESGFELTDEHIKRIKKVKNKRKRIETCIGCIYSTTTIKRALKEFDTLKRNRTKMR